MASRAYKFGPAESAQCQCCRDGVEETTAHISQCPNRNEIHILHSRKLTELLADKQIPNELLHLIEAGIDLALLSDNSLGKKGRVYILSGVRCVEVGGGADSG